MAADRHASSAAPRAVAHVLGAVAFVLGAVALILAAVAPASGQTPTAANLAPGQDCALVTWENAEASAGTPNIQHDGSPLPGIEPPDISAGFQGIPRSAQPALTASQERILECSYHLPEANADMPYTLFVPTSYDPATPTPLVVDLHGLNITPLQQMLFDGTTDFAERHGFIVVAPMGFNLSGFWGARPGNPVETAATNPETGEPYTTGELSELDALTLLGRIREAYTVDPARIYLMGHSMGGFGTWHLGGAHPDIWAGIAPIAGGGLSDAEAAERYLSTTVLVTHGELDSIVPVTASRAAVRWLQEVGAQHLYIEVPGADHEFWIRRGAENMEKLFLFFETVSKRTNVGPVTEEMLSDADA